jgi:D-alanyl-D-alanine carboxypeptidase
MRKHSAFFLVAFILVSGCGSDSDTTHKATLFSASLQQMLDETVTEYHAPGAVLSVRFDDGSIWTGVSGSAEIGGADSRPMQETYRFRIGSVTKTFTGTAALLLVQRGLLSLDDSLEALLPGVIPDGEHITVEMLLNHSSGLYDYTHDDSFQDAYLDDLTRTWTTNELLQYVLAEDPLFPPGQGAKYSNTNYLLLGMLIESVSGSMVKDFIQTEIIEPLGLSDTYFPAATSISGEHTNGYLDFNLNGVFDVSEDVTPQSPSAMWSAGAVVSTPGDLLVWLDELITGTLLSAELQARRFAFEKPIDEHPTGFFGLGVAKMDGGVGHTGAVPGYTTCMFRYKDTDIVAYCNGYYLGATAPNVSSRIYEKAVQMIFPGDEVHI